MSNPSNVLIYCDHLLPYSATFIRSQAEALQQFIPYYTGCRRVEGGLPLPGDRTLLINQGSPMGKAAEVAYKLGGIAPGLVQRARRLQPRLIHAHFGPDGVRAMPLARQLKLPLLVSFHGYDATVTPDYARSLSHRTYLQQKSRLQSKAAGFIAISKFLQDRLLRQGFPEDKVQLHYIGIDTDQFCPDPTVTRRPIVLFTGRLVEKKGGEYLIRAMSQVQQGHPEAELVVIGDGPQRPELEQMAQRLLRHYQFLGMQSPEAVRQWMNQAQIFCVPSVTAASGDSEAFGIVFAEAQAMGLPVVSFASGGIPEAVAHGHTGFLAAERDWPTLADYICLLLQRPTLRQQLSQAGQERIRTRFNLHHQTRKLETLYESLLCSHGLPAASRPALDLTVI